jgi:hypothetical protein
MAARKAARLGQAVRLVPPSSGACLHMGVAGVVRVLEAGAQILNEDGSEYSSPITHGEAGLIRRVPRRESGDKSTGAASDVVFWYSPAV